MTNKCFITEFNVSVNNDNLKKFGVMTLGCSNNNNGKSFNIESSEPITLKAQGGGFTDSSYQNPSPTIDIPANRNISVYLEKNKGITIEVPSKYGLTVLMLSIGVYVKDNKDIDYCTSLKKLTLGSALPGTIIFEYLTSLEIFRATYKATEFRGNIEELANAANLKELDINHSSGLSGNISALSGLTNLKTIDLEGTYINGDANIFADNTKFAGLSLSGAILKLHNAYGISNKTEEVKTAIEAAHPGITVTI